MRTSQPSQLARPRAVIYIRGATESIDDEIERGRRLSDARGWVVITVLDDMTTARARRARRGFAKLMNLIADGEVDVVIVGRLSDIFCTAQEALEVLATLGRAGVTLVAVDGAFDTSRACTATAMAAFVLDAVLGASLEGRVMAVGSAVARGRRIGRPKVRIDAEVVRDLLARGWPLRRLAREVRVGYGTLQRFQAAARVDVPR